MKLFIALFAIVVTASAQVDTGTISGLVRDSSGAGVPRARVVLRHDETGNLASNPPEFIVSAFTNNQFDVTGARPASAGFDRPAAGTLDGATLNAVDRNSRTSYTGQWNFSLQRELPKAFNLTVAYVGTKGTKLEARPDINLPVPGTTPIAARRPYPRYQSILESENRQSSIDHGLQVTGERRLARGFSILAGYT